MLKALNPKFLSIMCDTLYAAFEKRRVDLHVARFNSKKVGKAPTTCICAELSPCKNAASSYKISKLLTCAIVHRIIVPSAYVMGSPWITLEESASLAAKIFAEEFGKVNSVWLLALCFKACKA